MVNTGRSEAPGATGGTSRSDANEGRGRPNGSREGDDTSGRAEASPRAAAVEPRSVSPDRDGGGSSLRKAYRRYRSPIHGLASVILAVTLWEVAAANTSPLVFVSLTSVVEALWTRIDQGLFWRDFAATSSAFLIGYVIASIAGIIIGLVIATSDLVHDLFQPWVSALYSTPVIALAPLFIVVFGIGLTSKIAVVVLLAIFPVIINTTAGIRDTDRQLIEGAYAFGATRLDIFRLVLIPASVPYVITGLRLAVGRGLIAVVVAEFFGARAGLGHMVFQSSQRFDTATLFAGVLLLALAGTLLINLMHRLERWIAPWRDFKIP